MPRLRYVLSPKGWDEIYTQASFFYDISQTRHLLLSLLPHVSHPDHRFHLVFDPYKNNRQENHLRRVHISDANASADARAIKTSVNVTWRRCRRKKKENFLLLAHILRLRLILLHKFASVNGDDADACKCPCASVCICACVCVSSVNTPLVS